LSDSEEVSDTEEVMNTDVPHFNFPPVLPLPPKEGGGWEVNSNIWIFLAAFVGIIAVFAIVALIRFMRTRNSDKPPADATGEFVQSKDVSPRDLYADAFSSPTCLPTPPPTATTSPLHTLNPPQVIITPPTPNSGEEERTKKRACSLGF
ncbi:hypothetical protein PENTCL1PPCAC_28808, partial [Pristionchus entomophagus]